MSSGATKFYLNAKDAGRPQVLQNLIDFLERLPQDKPWCVGVERYVKPRNEEQNNALWGVAYKHLREQSGNDMDDLHEFFCGEFFGWVIKDVMGQRKKKPRRSTTQDEHGKRSVMDIIWFAQFYDFIQQRATENGFYVPDPDPLWRQKVMTAKAKGEAK